MAEERVKIRYDIDGAEAGAKKTNLLGASIKSLLSPTVLVSAGIAAIGIAIGKMIQAAEESRRVMAQTDAVLKSTGGAAGVTSKQVVDLAQSLSTMTDYDDEAIQSAENLLLTFTNIKDKVFPQATVAVLDMSAALGQDLKSSAIQLGKALNDPINGMVALRRVGVSFNEQQKDQIKLLQESGKTLEAQKIILSELQKEFGGVAQAVASPSKILGNAFHNLYEALGNKLLPSLNEFSREIAKVINKITEFVSSGDQFDGFRKAMDSLSPKKITEEMAKLNKERDKLINQNDSISILNVFRAKEKKETIDGIEQVNAKLRILSDRLISLKSKSPAKETPQVSGESALETAISLHSAAMSSLKASGQYAYDKEISDLERIRNAYARTAKEKADITEKINAVIIKKNEDATKSELDLIQLSFDRKKALGQTNVQDEIANEQSKLNVANLSEQQKREINDKIYQAQTQLQVQELENSRFLFSEEQKNSLAIQELKRKGVSEEMQATGTLLGAARELGDGKLTIEEAINKGILDQVKNRIIAEVDAEAEKLAIMGVAHLATLNPVGFLEIAEAAVISAGIRAALKSVKLATGGVVMPTPGGTQATIGEGGSAEAVIPLDSKKGREALGGGGGETRVIILDSDGVTTLAKGVFARADYLQSTGQMARSR